MHLRVQSLARWWAKRSTAGQLLVILTTLAALAIGLIIAATLILLNQGLRIMMDRDLQHHQMAVRSRLERELEYLQNEARTLANLDGLDVALRSHDTAHVERLLRPVFILHGLSGIYVFTPDGELILAIGDSAEQQQAMPGPEVVAHVRNAQSASLFTNIGETIGFVGVAPQYDQQGEPQAVLAVYREVSHDFLVTLRTQLGPDLVLQLDGNVETSLHEEPDALLAALGNVTAVRRAQMGQYFDVVIGGSPYRVLGGSLSLAAQPGLQVAILQPTELVSRLVSQATMPILLLGVLLFGVTFVLIRFLIIRVFQPIQELEAVAARMAGGELEYPVHVRGVKEVTRLAASFEQMRTRLLALLETQRTWNEQLEDEVRKRTAELQHLCVQRDRLIAKVIVAQEEEQRRIARELHDETSQSLANLIVNLGMIMRLAQTDEEREHLAALRAQTVECLDNLKRLVLDLRPRLLDDYGLLPAIRWHVQNRLTDAGIHFEIDEAVVEVDLPGHVQTGVFRVVQEAISNVIRHADATHVTVRSHCVDGMLQIEVRDNGRGFDLERVTANSRGFSGLGLLGMKERAELAGGALSIESSPGEGTRVTVSIPLERWKVEEQYADHPSAAG